jgi:hypothetical protein
MVIERSRNMGKLSPREFCQAYLPEPWAEKDLQAYIKRCLCSKSWATKIIKYSVLEEERIKTSCTTRRADLSTWNTVYEVKCYLDYDTIYHAVAQTELYAYCGSKIWGIKRKKRAVIGLAPPQEDNYISASRLARDFRAMGIQVIFINEDSAWHHTGNTSEINNYLVIAVLVLLGLVLFLLAVSLAP